MHTLEASDSTDMYLEKYSHENKEACTMMCTAALFAVSKTENNKFICHINHNHITLPALNASFTSQGIKNNPNVSLHPIDSNKSSPSYDANSFSYSGFLTFCLSCLFPVFQMLCWFPPRGSLQTCSLYLEPSPRLCMNNSLILFST